MRITPWSGLGLFGLALLLESWAPAAPGDKRPARRAPISTHVLNTTSGKPAADVAVALQRQVGKDWKEVGRSKTNAQGRTEELYPRDRPLQAGAYRLIYETG